MVPSALSPVQIKVCGLTRLGDVEICRSLGIDWVGFNFWPHSKRFIKPEAANPLVSAAHGMKTVGVFVNPTLDEIRHAMEVTGIQYVQLHGHETWELIQSVPGPVIKALPADGLADMQGLPLQGPINPSDLGLLKYLLIDSPAGSAFGGTGKTFNWSLLRDRNLPVPSFLAGGLGQDNVMQAVEATHPFAVDLNSKVESSPGIKDAEKLRATVRALRPTQNH